MTDLIAGIDHDHREGHCPTCGLPLSWLPNWRVYGCPCLWGHEPTADEVADLVDAIELGVAH